MDNRIPIDSEDIENVRSGILSFKGTAKYHKHSKLAFYDEFPTSRATLANFMADDPRASPWGIEDGEHPKLAEGESWWPVVSMEVKEKRHRELSVGCGPRRCDPSAHG